MYIKVKLLKGFQKTLTYKVPDEWEIEHPQKNLVGKIVRVPIKNNETRVVKLLTEHALSISKHTPAIIVCIRNFI